MSSLADKSFEDEELTEFHVDPVDDEDDEDESIHTHSQQSRGRPRIQEKWTRVINTTTTDVTKAKTYVIASDLLMASGLSKEKVKKKGQ